MKTGIELIAEERQRQIESEGWSSQHDSFEHEDGSLAIAGACYALGDPTPPAFWPWNYKWWKPTPKNRIRELQKAGALIAAEIDRLNNIEK